MHGLTEAQIKARAKAMGAHVVTKIKDWKRQEALAAAESEAAHIYDNGLIERRREKERLISLHKRDEFEDGQHDADALAAEQAELAEIDDERARLRAERAKPRSMIRTAEVDGWMANQSPNVKWRPNIPVIAVPKGSAARKELDKIRAEVDAIKASIRGAETAWLPEEDAVAKAVAQIDKIAIKGSPDFRGLFRLSKPSHVSRHAVQGEIEWPQKYINSDFHNDGFALAVWLHRDALVERARKEIAALARPESALSVALREAKIAALRVQLLQAERIEHAAFLLAFAEDKSLQPRKVDMRALLQIEEVPESEAPAEATDALEFG